MVTNRFRELLSNELNDVVIENIRSQKNADRKERAARRAVFAKAYAYYNTEKMMQDIYFEEVDEINSLHAEIGLGGLESLRFNQH